MSVAVALCAFTGSAADQQEEEWEHGTDPIIHLIGDFILSTAPEGWPLDLNFQKKLAEKIAEYDARIASNDRVNEAYVCRALTLLTSLSHYGPMELLVSRFGFGVLDQDGTIKFTRQTLGGGFDT